jgi:toxin ParE1/3/4
MKKTADRVTGKIFDNCRSYTRFPESGRFRTELAPGLRSFAVEPYVVFYRPFGETISVIRILHGHRDIKRIIDEVEEP